MRIQKESDPILPEMHRNNFTEPRQARVMQF